MAGQISLPIMDEKRPVRSTIRSYRRNRPLLTVALVAVTLFLFCKLRAARSYASQWAPSRAADSDDDVSRDTRGGSTWSATKALVPLEAHIMSKCPDARDCLRDLVLPTMMRVNTKVNFTLSYIGTPTDSNDGVACKHGPNECMGNILELCAAHLYPDPKIYLGFVMCLTRDYKEIPQRELVEDCALEHAVDFEQLNDCATKDDGGFGVSLLRNSVKRSSSVCHLRDWFRVF
ncbi:hypothetical protein BKA67DRAFT_652470 [Truncatella angustata]|uniref:Gamma interferon inducible lysosomal thiol reductase n=1 Tax=Truncatella angustata TaxID=152316 RepID=A0A9P9A2B2_9PEZI|nr:uncharacterized protein BKA67DRAFT_652470 [Truncatella angustata]KAH6659222.1 hypothetical protein BKA67DRAFT_652470 [Truncatella angustata]KAH8198015.1 hypothetical protein TruAng_007840 [Truncatella angustata]